MKTNIYEVHEICGNNKTNNTYFCASFSDLMKAKQYARTFFDKFRSFPDSDVVLYKIDNWEEINWQ